jgi:MerR family copper efflux transcriptional regulator
MDAMNMSQAADATGLPAKTIRYYESVGLIQPSRRPNGYRSFSELELRKLTLLARARRLGFSVEECRKLLRLYSDDARTCAEVRSVAIKCLERLERQLQSLSEMRANVSRLIEHCPNDDRPDCPIIETLADAHAGMSHRRPESMASSSS